MATFTDCTKAIGFGAKRTLTKVCESAPYSPRFDLRTLRLRRTRWAAGVSGMISAAGFGAGKNASKNNVAGRSQKSIAALSIGLFLSWDRNGKKLARNCRHAPSGRIRECGGFPRPT